MGGWLCVAEGQVSSGFRGVRGTAREWPGWGEKGFKTSAFNRSATPPSYPRIRPRFKGLRPAIAVTPSRLVAFDMEAPLPYQ